jgi:hypothetical protein
MSFLSIELGKPCSRWIHGWLSRFLVLVSLLRVSADHLDGGCVKARGREEHVLQMYI